MAGWEYEFPWANGNHLSMRNLGRQVSIFHKEFYLLERRSTHEKEKCVGSQPNYLLKKYGHMTCFLASGVDLLLLRCPPTSQRNALSI
eukprot:scaffold27129_cov73-Attheya_sp.AAC.4